MPVSLLLRSSTVLPRKSGLLGHSFGESDPAFSRALVQACTNTSFLRLHFLLNWFHLHDGATFCCRPTWTRAVVTYPYMVLVAELEETTSLHRRERLQGHTYFWLSPSQLNLCVHKLEFLVHGSCAAPAPVSTHPSKAQQASLKQNL